MSWICVSARKLACGLAFVALPLAAQAASWTKLANLAPGGGGVMLQLTDGTVMIQRDATASWMRLTPDASGSYINGIWTANPISAMSTPRLYFASVLLTSGKLWVLGGEYSGAQLNGNWTPTGELYDPVANSWSPIAQFPNQPGCPAVTVTTKGNLSSGSNIITAIPSTTGFTVGKGVSGTGVPSGATISSVDSATQVHISANATASGTQVTLNFASVAQAACYGDVPAMLLPDGKVLAGSLVNRDVYVYDVATNGWTKKAAKFYNDSSDEETWVKLPDGRVLTYDIFKSIPAGTGYAEIYDPVADLWTPISPADGTANGVLPVLSSVALGYELGGGLRLQDGRVLFIGANGRTALYTPSTNTWAAGPDIIGKINGNSAAFGADDAPAAIMPNGHVLMVADAGPAAFSSSGNLTSGSNIITGIPSTALLSPDWGVTGTGIPSGAYITSVDSATQVHISANATATRSSALAWGGVFSPPTQIFDYDPSTGTIAPLSPAIPNANLNTNPAYITRLLVLPTGQVLFSDSSTQLWVYTPDGASLPAARPVINGVNYRGGGVFTLTGRQINGQSAGSSYGDDVASDQNYPIIRLVNAAGGVYYCRTSNWSSTAVGGGDTLQTVDFTLKPGTPAGNYSLILSGAGNASFPLFISISAAQAVAAQKLGDRLPQAPSSPVQPAPVASVR
jgi:hypothetical protein